MKKIKYLFCLFFILLFTTGCDVTYNLEILGDNYNELVVVPGIGNLEEKYPVVAFYGVSGNMENPNEYAEYVEYYKDEVDLKDEVVTFKYSFLNSEFIRSNFANTCYKNFTFLKDNETGNLIISTDRKFLCFDKYKDLNNVKIKIKTNHEVISSNAHDVDDDIYIWNITKENKDDISISMVLSSEVMAKKLSFFERNALFIIFSGATIIGGIIYIFMKKRSERVNEI